MHKRMRFTGSFKSSVSFDRKEIRKKNFIPTFRQARRRVNIYDALIQEFYEDGCTTSAKYFQILIDKEHVLYKNSSIRDRICDEPELLLNLFDSCKMAERAALSKQFNGSVICSRLLLQCILVFGNYDKKFDWILMDVFKIIIKIVTKVCQAEDVSKEPLCQIYYKFGIYLIKCDLEEAVKYLEKSFDLAQGNNWTHNEEPSGNKSVNFSSFIARMYATALLNHANNIFSTTPENAISQAQKALMILMRVGVERNKTIYIKGCLDVAEFHLKADNYETSLAILENIIKYIRGHVNENLEYSKFLSRYNHLKGVCFKFIKKYDFALSELFKSLKIVRQLDMKQEEAIILLDIARVYIDCGSSQFSMAESCLRQSKEIFVLLNDMLNTQKTSYLMANLKMHNVKPLILDLIKLSSTNYCDKHRLFHWKSLCSPFWRNLQVSLLNEDRNSLQCIWEKTETPINITQRKSFKLKVLET